MTSLCYIGVTKTIVAASSDGYLRGYDLEGTSQWNIKAHELAVNQIALIGEYGVVLCLTDGVKVWDLRNISSDPTHCFTNPKETSFLSVAVLSDGNYVAGGTELKGTDAEIYIWDIRNPSEPYRAYVDSHHDDVTYLLFHPTLDNYLMLGLTDGYVNIINIAEADEDELLHQVINFALVHLCHWDLERRISVLSHMETLAFFDLNDTNYEEQAEAQPNDMGDVRLIWPDCEYVVDVLPAGYVSYGANSKSLLTLLPFNPATEAFDDGNPVWFPEAHGEEVVRDLLVIPYTTTAITCGEDGQVKIWTLPKELKHYDFTNPDERGDDMDIDEAELNDKKDNKDKKDKKGNKDKKDKKEKKEKREKIDKEKKDRKGKDKHKSKRDKKEKRFKPY